MVEFRRNHEWYLEFDTSENYMVRPSNRCRLACVPREILKPSSNQKDYEIHKNIKVIRVNNDCLAEIFMYVPTCERPKIALVCKKWKQALDYSWGNVKKLELTHWEYDDNQSCLKKYPTAFGKLRFLKSLLYKCGSYLKQLDLTAYGYSDIVPVINEYCPNLMKLRLRFINDNEILKYDAFSRLSKLITLEIIFQYLEGQSKLFYVMIALESLANTLVHLILCNLKDDFDSGWCQLPGDITIAVLRKFKALKRLEIGGFRISDKLDEYLINKENMSLYSLYDYYGNSKSKKLTELNFAQRKVLDSGLYTIANTIKELTRFIVNCRLISNDGVVAISKINKLEHLCFVGINNNIHSSVKFLKNLSSLTLPQSNKITDYLATKVLENSPKMEVLSAAGTSITVEFIKKAAEISRNRKQHLHLCVSLMCETKKYETPYLTVKVDT